MTDLITCQHVGYSQHDVDILTDIDWRIERGQHWAVLGPNGCGKTTLLRIASGYLWPTSGRVLRLGKELVDLGELRRSIAWISADLAGRIPPENTGLETVVTGRLGMIGLKHLPFNEPTEKDFADAAVELARLGCESLAEKPFGILSQGERQQVLVARARIIGPLLLVLDEACAGMDPGVRERFLHWLNEYVTADRRMDNPVRPSETIATDKIVHPTNSTDRIAHPTLIFVTHHVEEIMPGVENTIILRGGRVHSSGRTRDVVTRDTIETVYDTRLTRLDESGGRLWPIWGG